MPWRSGRSPAAASPGGTPGPPSASRWPWQSPWHSSGPDGPTLEEVCDAIAVLKDAPVPSHTVDASVVRRRAEELLALSVKLSEAHASCDGNSATPRQPPSKALFSTPVRTPVRSHPQAASAAWADRPVRRVECLQQLVAMLIVVGLTLPYYLCVGYTSWFVDEGFAIHRNPDARGETPVLEVLRHDFWGTSLTPPDGYVTHKSYRPLITLSYALDRERACRLICGVQPFLKLASLMLRHFGYDFLGSCLYFGGFHPLSMRS